MAGKRYRNYVYWIYITIIGFHSPMKSVRPGHVSGQSTVRDPKAMDHPLTPLL
jgi:hypothetical protein